MRLQPGPAWAIIYETDPPTIIFPEKDLEDKSWQCNVASAMHEGGHRDITWVDPFFYHDENLRFLHNAIEDPRVNNWLMMKMKGTRHYLEDLYKESFPIDQEQSFDDATVLPHIQYGLGVIHYWFHGKEHPAIRNRKVLGALRKTRKDVTRTYQTLAGTVSIGREKGDKLVVNSPVYGRTMVDSPRIGQILTMSRPDISGVRRVDEQTFVFTTGRGHEEVMLLPEGEERQILVSLQPDSKQKVYAAKQAAKIIKEKILPEYQELVNESIQAAKKGLEGDMSGKGAAGKPGKRERAKSGTSGRGMDGTGSTETEMDERGTEGTGTGGGPTSGRPSKSEIEEKAREKVREKSREAADTLGGKIPVKDSEYGDMPMSSTPSLGSSAEGEKTGERLGEKRFKIRKKSKDEKWDWDKEKTSGKGSEESDEIEIIISDEPIPDDAPLSATKGEGSSIIIAPVSKKGDTEGEKIELPPEIEEEIRKYLSDIKSSEGEGEDEGMEVGGEGAEGEKRDESTGEFSKYGETEEEGFAKGDTGERYKDYIEKKKRLTAIERLKLRQRLTGNIEKQLGLYDKYYVQIAHLVEQLFGILDNELHRDIKPKYKGDYGTGPKLNLRKAMPMKVTGDTDIWLRRVKPTKRSFKFVLVLDESGSMGGGESEKSKNAILGIVLVQEVLSRLGIDFAIIGYSNAPSTHKGFDKKFEHIDKDLLMSEIIAFYNRGGGNDEVLSLGEAIEQIEPETGDTKTIIFFSDGQLCTDCNPNKLKELFKKAEKKQIRLIGIGIGRDATYVRDWFSPGIYVEDVKKLPEVLGKILIDIIVYKKARIEVAIDRFGSGLDLRGADIDEEAKDSAADLLAKRGRTRAYPFIRLIQGKEFQVKTLRQKVQEEHILIIDTTDERAEAIKEAVASKRTLPAENIYAIAQPQLGQAVDEILRQKYGEVPNIDYVFNNSGNVQLAFGSLANKVKVQYGYIEDVNEAAENIDMWL